ncbi:proline-rich receptor-like protein kinase PERK2 [Iris pallida]|uniref:Proline-rich receptor-like protein kinase PERK2 n=1 Tax=Iris pallida TaxID=29817 RepID=A0AAX6FHJ5_IRIPA|nr:proline-rich receptor-like protein kinase PERK2 [Iris pallida]
MERRTHGSVGARWSRWGGRTRARRGGRAKTRVRVLDVLFWVAATRGWSADFRRRWWWFAVTVAAMVSGVGFLMTRGKSDLRCGEKKGMAVVVVIVCVRDDGGVGLSWPGERGWSWW